MVELKAAIVDDYHMDIMDISHKIIDYEYINIYIYPIIIDIYIYAIYGYIIDIIDDNGIKIIILNG